MAVLSRFQATGQNTVEQPPLPDSVSQSFEHPSQIIERAEPTKSCGPNDKSGACERTGSNSNILPIVLGAGIPLLCALVVLFWLHRRHVKKLRKEDASDRVKALDFGMGEVSTLSKKKSKHRIQPEMTVAEAHKELRRDRGMSLDLDVSNPYLLPPGLQTSRESIHSLSRSSNHGYDPYRPATTYISTDRYPSQRRGPDDSSSYTASTHRTYNHHDNESSQNLLRNAQRMSRSLPPTQRNSLVSGNSTPLSPELSNGQIPRRPPPLPRQEQSVSPHPQSKESSTFTSAEKPFKQPSERLDLDQSLRDSPPLIDTRSPPPESQMPTLPSLDEPSHSPAPVNAQKPTLSKPVGLPSNPRAGKSGSPVNNDPASSDILAQPLPQLTVQALDGQFGLDRNQSPPHQEFGDQQSTQQHTHTEQTLKYKPDFDYDPRRLTMGIRPLPPEDPTENPEERANRIRSFYKEYFDDSKPGPVYTQENYYDGYNYDNDYDGAYYDPATGEYLTTQLPFAEHIGRRAMTPPARGPPQFHGMAPSMSPGNFASGPRAYSSASGRFGPGRQPSPKKAAPPPAPLQVLPTPHMLKDDTFLPIDFAPPTLVRDRVAGRVPDSPKGGLKPFAHLQAVQSLASSFDDLAIMPSPHALRKSSTFTALDFAPPPRFKNSDSGSDAGSIRSNRSGRSAMQVANIRAGAYRLSRIPREVAGTKDDLATALRPTWDMRK
ncbi:MAG: hypothetical protein Q9160_003988 [Pyrenula sp. 1 TL-2023]